jgi:hypothetical protein
MGQKLWVQWVRQELTDGQRVLMGELLPVQTFAPPPPQDPVQVHVHVAGGSGTATSGSSWLALTGAVTIGILVYSLYQGQPVSVTVARIESALASAAIPQWWDSLKQWVETRTPAALAKPASTVVEAQTSAN